MASHASFVNFLSDTVASISGDTTNTSASRAIMSSYRSTSPLSMMTHSPHALSFTLISIAHLAEHRERRPVAHLMNYPLDHDTITLDSTPLYISTLSASHLSEHRL
jgi:hypothetical protein